MRFFAELFEDVKMEWVLAIVIVIMGMIALVIAATIKDAKEWSRFAAEHDCKLIEVRPGESSSGVAVGADGKVGVISMSTPERRAYKCNDGVTYWR